MNVFPIPENPKKNNIERRSDVVARTAWFLGSSILAAVSIRVAITAPELSADRDIFGPTSLAASMAASFPVISELMERYTKNGPGKEWRKDAVEPDPMPPGPPSGSEPDLIEEIEAYLGNKTPVSV